MFSKAFIDVIDKKRFVRESWISSKIFIDIIDRPKTIKQIKINELREKYISKYRMGSSPICKSKCKA